MGSLPLVPDIRRGLYRHRARIASPERSDAVDGTTAPSGHPADEFRSPAQNRWYGRRPDL